MSMPARVRLAICATLLVAANGAGTARADAEPHLVPFGSTLYPYTMKYPAGWRHRVFTLSTLKTDMFLAPASAQFDDNVNLLREPLPAGIKDDAALLRANEQQLAQLLKRTAQTVGRVTIAGHRVAMIGYKLPFGGVVISTTQAVLAYRGYAWTFTLSVMPKDTTKERPLFAAMLGTFKAR